MARQWAAPPYGCSASPEIPAERLDPVHAHIPDTVFGSTVTTWGKVMYGPPSSANR